MVDPRTAALLLIDMQHGFIDAESALCVAGAAATVPACAQALERARELGCPVFHVVREYAPDGSNVEAVRYEAWAAGGKPLSRACEDPHSGDEPAELAPQPGDYVVVKPRFSAFFGTALDAMLRRLGVRTVVLAGTTTPNCVRATCYDALSLGYNAVVLDDCTSSRTPAVQAANIEDMAHIGAQVVTCAEFREHGLANVRDVEAEVARAVAAEAGTQAADGAGAVAAGAAAQAADAVVAESGAVEAQEPRKAHGCARGASGEAQPESSAR